MQFLLAQFFYVSHLQICSQPVHMFLISTLVELLQAEMAMKKARVAGNRLMQEEVPLINALSSPGRPK